MEGLEEMFQDYWWNPRTGVRDAEVDKFPCACKRMSLDIVLFHNLVPPAYRQRPLALHGITCVHREVEQDLCDLRLVHQDVPRRQLVVTDDLHGGRQGLLQQYQGRVEDVSDFRGYRQDHGAAAEGQQSFREVGSLMGGSLGCVQILQQLYQGRVEDVSDFRGYRQDHGAAAEGQQSFREVGSLMGGSLGCVQILQQ